ncbi:hypothetical protein FA15DRAFT_664822 [Coprinopsis marcescibilis]|uniref:Actin cytoskeleton-regulatory complex protein SLA1 n=1 Tax=Coprinopsis marcescibilis TaxID=230819 RepID=A0A5C3L7P1_COPMA|nr:hypothetical protein FA15DRAFT_664822 [Coprinopsis marcescibilis]
MPETPELNHYLAILKASYDYTPQSDDEIGVKEDQLLFLIERTDEEWWKVKVKGNGQDDEGPVGLVPAAYVEQAEHSSLVKAVYDYEPTAPGELGIKEDDVLRLFESDGDWILAQSHSTDGAGYVPANYVEESSEEQPTRAAPQIVIPDSPPRPSSTYVDPADRVASHKITADDIKTWSVSELDKKGKKKKGTLGIGRGSLFFASESDKTAVQKWQTSDVSEVTSDKPKHVQIVIGGPNPATLHFHAGSKDNAEEIVAKTQSSKAFSNSSASPVALDEGTNAPSSRRLPPMATGSTPRDNKNVHFHPAGPVIIPASPQEDSDEEEEEDHNLQQQEEQYATTLYDFTADGEDELSVSEGERLAVLERDGDDWWKCRNARGKEGMVPASYLEIASGDEDNSSSTAAQAAAAAAASAAAEVQERKRLAQKEKERAERAEREAEEERQREEEERAREKKEAQDRARAAAAEAERDRRKQLVKKPVSPPPKSSPQEPPKPNGSSSSKLPTDLGKPPAEKIRVWHDRTGQFRVEAAFLGFSNGKLRLHKVNGVVVEVPTEKMSHEDMRFVEKVMAKKQRGQGAVLSDDEVPLTIVKGIAQLPVPPKKGPKIDWFDFFLSAGCDVDDCTRYASAFEKDKMDETLLPDITDSIMRSLGLKEGDIIRVKKAIEKRKPNDNFIKPSPYVQDQILRDEELARQLQAAENSGRAPPPNLFAGPKGELKAPRRGRPQPNNSVPSNVDLKALSSASDAIQRTSSPRAATPTSTNIQPPPRSSSTLVPTSSGFDDDAWTNRPSSTKPISNTPPPAAIPRASSADASAQPPRAPQPTPTATVASPPPQPTPQPPVNNAPLEPPKTLASTTESDIFNQLARLSELKKPASPPVAPSQMVQMTPPVMQNSSPFPVSAGMGMGHTHLQMGQISQNPTFSPPLTLSGPRGPFAPVPANQGLLQPLIPTQTGFTSFVPTRAPAFSTPPPLPQNNHLQPFNGSSMMLPQQTGIPMNNGFVSQLPIQQTGFPANNFGSQIPMQQQMGFGQLQHHATGFAQPMNSNFNSFSNVPPVPPLPSNQVKDTSPANVFASMKSGTFEDNSDPFSPPPPMQMQPTGWVGQGYQGYR